MGENRRLSNQQKEVYDLLTKEFLTPKQISKRRGTTIRAVYKTIDKLRKKGCDLGGSKTIAETGGVHKPELKKLRLHNIQIPIKIISKKKGYENLLKRCNKLSISGCTIMLYEKMIDVYTGEDTWFMSGTVDGCYVKAVSYFRTVYNKIENRCEIEIEKDQYLNKKWVRQHIAVVDDEIAKDCNKKKEKLKIYDREDGKERVLVDDSHSLNELEAVHPKKAKPDAEYYKEFIDDLIVNKPPVNSEMYRQLYAIAKNQDVYNKNIELHLDVLRDMKEAIKDLSDKLNGQEQKTLLERLKTAIKTRKDAKMYKGWINRLSVDEHMELMRFLLLQSVF